MITVILLLVQLSKWLVYEQAKSYLMARIKKLSGLLIGSQYSWRGELMSNNEKTMLIIRYKLYDIK